MRSLLSLSRLADGYYRVCFLGAAASCGLLRLLAAGGQPPRAIADALAVKDLTALEEWLEVGVSVGVLRRSGGLYALADALGNRLAEPACDDVAALFEEMVGLHHQLITQAPVMLRADRKLGLGDHDAKLVARSSRMLEALVQDAMRDVIPVAGSMRLLEVGCGSATHIRFAAERNPDLRALGLELAPEVAAFARENLARWGLAERAAVELGDVRERAPAAEFDVVTLHQNVYYFPPEERVAVLAHIRGFVRPGGRFLLTTACRGGAAPTATLSLWGAMTAGCSALPESAQLSEQLGEAGFRSVRARNLLAPLDRFFAFTATV